MSSEIKHIQLTWTDLSNITRCLVVTDNMFDNQFKQNGASVAECILCLPFTADIPELLRPVQINFKDNTVPRPLAWCPKGQISFGRFYNDDGQPSPFCPRSFLFKQEARLREANLQITVGFELEFILLNSDGSRVDTTLFAQTKALQSDTWNILTEVVEALIRDFGIPVWRYHAESVGGQFEISIGPFLAQTADSCAVEAADSLVLAREAIYHIAAKCGKQATFVPKPFPDGIASGAHVHISLKRNSENVFENKEHHEEGCKFLAGVFKNLPNLLLIFAPCGNSYERLQPSTWSGAFQCIGTQNKEAAIRLIKNKVGILDRFEIKPIDGTSNPYLVLGAIIGAGLKGISSDIKLPQEVECDPATFPIEDQPPRLPESLEAAIEVFKASAFNRELFGDELHEMIAKLRSTELKFWNSTEIPKDEKMKIMLRRY